MSTFTATITVPISIELPTTATTEQELSEFVYEATEPLLQKLEETGEWQVKSWGWTDLWYDNEKGTHIVHIEGCLNIVKQMQAENELEVFDYFSENYSIPELHLPITFDVSKKFFVSKITDGKTAWEYDDRGFVVWCSDWKTRD